MLSIVKPYKITSKKFYTTKTNISKEKKWNIFVVRYVKYIYPINSSLTLANTSITYANRSYWEKWPSCGLEGKNTLVKVTLMVKVFSKYWIKISLSVTKVTYHLITLSISSEVFFHYLTLLPILKQNAICAFEILVYLKTCLVN